MVFCTVRGTNFRKADAMTGSHDHTHSDHSPRSRRCGALEARRRSRHSRQSARSQRALDAGHGPQGRDQLRPRRRAEIVGGHRDHQARRQDRRASSRSPRKHHLRREGQGADALGRASAVHRGSRARRFHFVPPYVPHQEINASRDEVLECVLVRSDGQAVAVNLDIEPVEKPETVLWVDPVHRDPAETKSVIARVAADDLGSAMADAAKASRMRRRSQLAKQSEETMTNLDHAAATRGHQGRGPWSRGRWPRRRLAAQDAVAATVDGGEIWSSEYWARRATNPRGCTASGWARRNPANRRGR